MMKRLFTLLLYTLFFISVVLFFLPKENLYYMGEHYLEPLKVVISNEKVVDKGFSLEISSAEVYAMDGIKVADIAQLNATLLAFYNKISIEDVALTSVASKFVPTHIDHVSILYSVLDPLHINAEAVGDFGEATAVVNLQERVVIVTLEPSKLMKTRFQNSMKMLKKSKTGAYTYEQRF